MWYALAVSAKWVDHQGVTNAHFGQCACLGLWLLGADHGNWGLLSAVPNLDATTINQKKFKTLYPTNHTHPP